MKKKAILTLSALFLAHSFISATPAWWNNLTQKLRQSPGALKRTWFCAVKPAQYNCTQAEHKRGIAWLAGGGTALATLLFGAGIKISREELQNQQKMAQQQMIEGTEIIENPALGRLMIAIILDNVPDVVAALAEKPNLNQRTNAGLPLERAMLNNNMDIVTLLLANGADPRLIRRDIETTPEIMRLINQPISTRLEGRRAH